MTDTCPKCDAPIVQRCKCLRNERKCANGHWHHNCAVHREVIVEGQSDHANNDCTCGKIKESWCIAIQNGDEHELVEPYKAAISTMPEQYVFRSHRDASFGYVLALWKEHFGSKDRMNRATDKLAAYLKRLNLGK